MLTPTVMVKRLPFASKNRTANNTRTHHVLVLSISLLLVTHARKRSDFDSLDLGLLPPRYLQELEASRENLTELGFRNSRAPRIRPHRRPGDRRVLMGTLPSSCFLNPSLRLRSFRVGGGFKERNSVPGRRIAARLCFLCKRKVVDEWEIVGRCDRIRCFSINGDGGNGEDKSSGNQSTEQVEPIAADEDRKSESTQTSVSPRTSSMSSDGQIYSSFQVDSFKLMELLGPEKVNPADVKLIKEKLFGYATFWVTREEPFGDLGEGVLFLGNLRGKREDVFAKLLRQLHEITKDKYNLFMVEEPNSEGPDPRGGPRVSFGLLRKEVSEPGPTTLWQYVIALLLFVLTIGSCVELGIASQINTLPPEVVKYFTDPNATEPPDMQLLYPYVESAIPLAYGVLGVQLFHEAGHFLAAFPKKVKLGIPFFIPNITLGSFGAITQFKSILPDRKTKVDVSMAGPLAGATLSVSMFTVGLLLSSNPAAAGDLVQVPSLLFQGSLLLGLISRATLGYTAMHAANVSIHPLVIAGWCGLTTSAFNMLPVGCLDGGRAIQGAFGKNVLFGCGLATYTLLGLGLLGGDLSLPWGLYVLICQRAPEKPCLNDVSEVGTWRRASLIIATFLVILTLLPLWDELAEDLGIGLVTSF